MKVELAGLVRVAGPPAANHARRPIRRSGASARTRGHPAASAVGPGYRCAPVICGAGAEFVFERGGVGDGGRRAPFAADDHCDGPSCVALRARGLHCY